MPWGKRPGADVRDFIAYVVTIAWAVTTGVDLFIRDYDPPPGVQQVMLVVVGAIFVDKIRRPNGNKEAPNGG